MPPDVSLQLHLKLTTPFVGQPGNQPQGVLQGFLYMHAWDFASSAEKRGDMFLAARDMDNWIDLKCSTDHNVA